MPAVQCSYDRLFREEAPENRKKQYFTAILAHSRESLQAREGKCRFGHFLRLHVPSCRLVTAPP